MSILGRIWKYAKWPVIVLALLYVALVIYEIPAVRQKDRSDAAVARIHAQKLTMADVDGKHLPPPPDPNLVDATVQGVDANGNGIRDDVELAIFKKYPDDIKLRAAELQYASALQQSLNGVPDSAAWKAFAFEESRSYACLSSVIPKDSNHSKNLDSKTTEIEDLVFNNNQRLATKEQVDTLITSFSLPRENFCDLST